MAEVEPTHEPGGVRELCGSGMSLVEGMPNMSQRRATYLDDTEENYEAEHHCAWGRSRGHYQFHLRNETHLCRRTGVSAAHMLVEVNHVVQRA